MAFGHVGELAGQKPRPRDISGIPGTPGIPGRPGIRDPQVQEEARHIQDNAKKILNEYLAACKSLPASAIRAIKKDLKAGKRLAANF